MGDYCCPFFFCLYIDLHVETIIELLGKMSLSRDGLVDLKAWSFLPCNKER